MGESQYSRIRNASPSVLTDAQYARRVLERTMTLLWRMCKEDTGTEGNPLEIDVDPDAMQHINDFFDGLPPPPTPKTR